MGPRIKDVLAAGSIVAVNLLILLTSFSCSKEPKILTVAMVYKYPESVLDPSRIQYTSDFFLLDNLTSKLVKSSESEGYELDLASSINRVSPTLFEVKIKKTFFSNNEPVTLIDVKESLERVLRLGSSHVNLNELVKRLDIKNDSLIIELTRPTQTFFYYLSLPDLGILHSSQRKKDVIQAKDYIDVSSGPFSYFSKSKTENFLVKNKFFELSEVNYPEAVRMVLPYDYNVIDEAIEGRIAIGKITLSDFTKYRHKIASSSKVKLLGAPTDDLTYILFNPSSKKFQNVAHRRWLISLIKDNFFVPEDFSGLAVKANQFFPKDSPAYLPEKELSSVLPKELVKPKDFPEKIVIKAVNKIFDITFEKLVRRLESIPGVTIVIENDVDPSERLSDLKSAKIDIFLGLISTDYRVPVEAIHYQYFSKVAELNDQTGKIKENFLKYQAAEDSVTSTTYLRNISKQIIEDAQIIPLFHAVGPYIVNTDLVDVGNINHLFIYNFWKFKAL